MKSLLSFLGFVVLSAALVAGVYFWRQTHPQPPEATSGVPSLVALDREFTSLVNQVLPAVVSINAIPVSAIHPRALFLQRMTGGAIPASSGSGVIVSPNGHIVTNLHVINGAGALEVQLGDGRALPAKVVGADPLSDIAILKIEATDLKYLPFGDSDQVKVGQMVFAVGNPLGLHETVTQGIISAKGRRAQSEAANEFFQTDAAINPGNSGGPLVNLRGEIIAINNSVSLHGQGIGFSIPSNIVRHVFESIRDHGRFIRPWFGAQVHPRPITPQLAAQLGLPDTSGALVLVVFQGSPAELGGLKPADVIVEYGGKPIRDAIDLRNRVVETDIGNQVMLRVRRGGREMEIPVVITAEPGA
jgi:serine protease Do